MDGVFLFPPLSLLPLLPLSLSLLLSRDAESWFWSLIKSVLGSKTHLSPVSFGGIHFEGETNGERAQGSRKETARVLSGSGSLFDMRMRDFFRVGGWRL